MDDLPNVIEIYNHDLSKVSKVAVPDYLSLENDRSHLSRVSKSDS